MCVSMSVRRSNQWSAVETRYIATLLKSHEKCTNFLVILTRSINVNPKLIKHANIDARAHTQTHVSVRVVHTY